MRWSADFAQKSRKLSRTLVFVFSPPRAKTLRWFKWGILKVLMSICKAEFVVRSADSKSKVTRTSTCQQFVVSTSAYNVLFIGNFVCLLLDAFVTSHMQSLNQVNIQPILLQRQNWETVWFCCHPYQAAVWIPFLGLVCAAFLCVVYRWRVKLKIKKQGFQCRILRQFFRFAKAPSLTQKEAISNVLHKVSLPDVLEQRTQFPNLVEKKWWNNISQNLPVSRLA